MIDVIFVTHKVELIREGLEELKNFENKTFDEVAKDWLSYHAVKNILMEIIGRAIDINQHLIAEVATPKIEAPLDYRETFLKLHEMKILSEDFALKIAKSAGFRNAIVHAYNHIDEKIVYLSVNDAISQYKDYCEFIMKYFEKKT